MQLDGFTYQTFYFLARCGSGNTLRKIRHVSRIVIPGFLNDYCVGRAITSDFTAQSIETTHRIGWNRPDLGDFREINVFIAHIETGA